MFLEQVKVFNSSSVLCKWCCNIKSNSNSVRYTLDSLQHNRFCKMIFYSPCQQLGSSKGSLCLCYFKHLYILVLSTCCRCNCILNVLLWDAHKCQHWMHFLSVAIARKLVAWTCLMMMTLKMKKHLIVKWIIIIIIDIWK